MPRTLPAGLADALASGSFDTYIRAKIYFGGNNAVDPDPANYTIVEVQPTYYKLGPMDAEIRFGPLTIAEMGVRQYECRKFNIERGVMIDGSPVTIRSGDFFVNETEFQAAEFRIAGHILANVPIDLSAGYITYDDVITAVINENCAKEISYHPSVFPPASYQFYPTGRYYATNNAQAFPNILRQKYIVFLCDNGEGSAFTNGKVKVFYAPYLGFNFSIETKLQTVRFKQVQRTFLWRDESNTIHTYGDDYSPLHNLGFLASSALAPHLHDSSHAYGTLGYANTSTGPHSLELAMNLTLQSGDHGFFYADPFDPDLPYRDEIEYLCLVTEYFNPKHSPSWYIVVENNQYLQNTEGGAMPSTIEAAAPYTPLVTGAFGGILSSADNNIQAAMETIDDHTHDGRYQDRSGFPNRTDSTISFNDATRVFTLAPTSTSFSAFTQGNQWTFTTPQTVTIPNTVGLHFIYISTSGVLTTSTSPWDITGYAAPVALAYWNGSAGAIGDERHSADRNRELHEWAHSTIGARYESGLACTFTNTTFSAATGTIFDEDIKFSLAAQTTCKLWYRNGSAMTFESAITAPYKAIAGALQYDNAGTLTPANTGRYVNSFVYATHDITHPIYIVVGQAQHTTLSAARSEAEPTFPNISTREWKLLYRVIYQNAAGTPTYIEASDYRTVSSLPGGSVATLPAASVTVTPAGTISSTNAQAALEELDSEKQPLDSDLTAIAALSPTNDDIIQRKTGAWTNRTMAQLAADLTTLAPLASPAFTGNPTAPTAAASDNDTSIATTAFVMAQRGDIPSGSTLPASPLANQLFVHTPTGRRVLMIYTGSVWYPVYSFGAMTTYVDGTSGTDAADKGYGTGANAYKTLSYMWTQIPSTFGGNVTVNVAAGTYAETLTCGGKTPGGAYAITLTGALATSDSGTVGVGVQGTGATPGSIQDVSKTWPVNGYVGYFAYSVNGGYRVITSNTVDTLTIDGTFAAVPSGAYSIVAPSVIIDGGAARSTCVTINSKQEVYFQFMRFTNSTSIDVSATASKNIVVVFSYCQFAPANGKIPIQVNNGATTFSYCDFANNGGYAVSLGVGRHDFTACNFHQVTGTKSGFGIILTGGNAGISGGCNISNFAYGIYAQLNAGLDMYQAISTGYHQVHDNTVGISAIYGGQIINTTNNIYSGNTTNTSASAASYAYIG